MFSPLPVFRDLDRSPDIRVLRALVACTQQQRDRRPALLEIDSVAGTVIDTHFAHARADRLHASGITEREAADACSDARLRLAILQSVEPFLERRGLQDFEHGSKCNPGFTACQPQLTEPARVAARRRAPGHSRKTSSRTSSGFEECDRRSWWVLTGSNRRHSPCKGDALPAEL